MIIVNGYIKILNDFIVLFYNFVYKTTEIGHFSYDFVQLIFQQVIRKNGSLLHGGHLNLLKHVLTGSDKF